MPKPKNKVVLRKAIAKHLLELRSKDKAHTKTIKQFARFVQKGLQAAGGDAQGTGSDTGGQATTSHLPCWGALIKSFEQSFTSDAARLQVLEALLASEDHRPLYLFLHSSCARPSLMEALCAEASRLPIPVQRVLVSMPQAASFIASNLHHFAPAAVALWEQGQVAMRREQQLFEVRINRLLAFEYFVPDSIAPGEQDTGAPTPTKPATPAPDAPTPNKPTEEPQ